jgi:chemotaxis protein methyltransferase CheR
VTQTLASIIELFHARTGIAIPANRRADAETAVHRAMMAAGYADADLFYIAASHDDSVFRHLVDHLTVGETYFFRDYAQFDEIRTRILPGLRAARGGDFTLRAWSAGCASGEEAYSLAMLLAEERQRTTILATDISQRALAKVVRGVYGPWSFRGHGQKAKSQCEPAGEQFAVPAAFRSALLVRHLNLATDSFPSLHSGTVALDLILCRNVLMYLDERTVAEVARKLHDSLGADGWLITAPSDPPLWPYVPFETVLTDAGVLYLKKAKPAERCVPDAMPSTAIRRPPQRETPKSKPRAQRQPARARLSRHDAMTSDIRTKADRGDIAGALATAESGLAHFPTSTELHYLLAIALLAHDREAEAIAALRRVIYLDRSLAVAHFVLGTVLTRAGDYGRARRAFKRVQALCHRHAADEAVPLADGERSEQLAAAAAAHLEILEPDHGDQSRAA